MRRTYSDDDRRQSRRGPEDRESKRPENNKFGRRPDKKEEAEERFSRRPKEESAEKTFGRRPREEAEKRPADKKRSRKSPEEDPKNSKHPIWTWFKNFWKRHNLTKILLLFILTVFLGVGSYLFYLAKTANVSDLQDSLRSTTTIMDKNGNQAGTMYGQKGTYRDIDQISPNIVNAVVATEDRSFYENRGVNLKRTVLAVATMGKFGGGSTITQQLAKNAYLTQKQTIDRKAKEIFLALEITKKYSKNDIMAMYLNNSYFGNGIWGVEDASHRYFGKNASDLTLDEGATLAGILKWPEVYNPLYKEGKFATDRRNTVLQNMVNAGLASAEEANAAAGVDMQAKLADDYAGRDDDYKYPSYFDAVIQEAISKYGLSEQDILNNGYKIYTGLDQNYQEGMQETYANTSLFPTAEDGTVAQSASVALDPKTGAVAGLIGRVPTEENNSFRGFNFATQAERSPGSTIKPLVVYTPAIEAGWSIDRKLEDIPRNWNGYAPQNYTRTSQGEVPMYVALAQSLNLPAVYTVDKLGVKTAVAKGREFGLDLTDRNEELQVALGGGVVTNPWQMAQAYSTFANDGVMNEAHLITKIENSNGQVIKSYKPSSKRVIDKNTSDKMTSMMLGTYSNGTGVYAEPYGYVMAGKTGTTETADENNTNDQWVIGYTPDVVMSLWLGFEKTDETHYLEGASSNQASAIFKNEASAILPHTAGTEFTQDNAYAVNGQAPVLSDHGAAPESSSSHFIEDTQERAHNFFDNVREKVEDFQIGERVHNLWENIRSHF